MSDFPNSIYSPRAIENRPGVVYDPDNTKTLYAEDWQQHNDEIVAIENALGANLGNLALNGWRPLSTIPTLQASDNPVYTLRFAADMTGILGLGNRIKLTQHGAVKYFIVVSVGAYTSGNTDVDVYGGTDYDMENTTTYPVTLPNFSIAKAPFGFPLDPAKWTELVSDTSRRTQTSPAQNSWYNLGSVLLAIPKGCWNVTYSVLCSHQKNSASTVAVSSTLSTSNNSVSDSDFYAFTASSDTSGNKTAWGTHSVSKFITLAAKTTYYLLTMTNQTATSVNIENLGDYHPTIIKAVCAYL